LIQVLALKELYGDVSGRELLANFDLESVAALPHRRDAQQGKGVNRRGINSPVVRHD
jgi:hypothetical protein